MLTAHNNTNGGSINSENGRAMVQMPVDTTPLLATANISTVGPGSKLAAALNAFNVMLWNAYMADNALLHSGCDVSSLPYKIVTKLGLLGIAAVPGWQLYKKSSYYCQHYRGANVEEPTGYENCPNWVIALSAEIEYFFTLSGGMTLVETFLTKVGSGFPCVGHYYTDPMSLLMLLSGAAILMLMYRRLRQMYTHEQPEWPVFAEWGYFIGSSIGKAMPMLRKIYRELSAKGGFPPKVLYPIASILFGTTAAYVNNRVISGQFEQRSPLPEKQPSREIQKPKLSSCKAASLVVLLIAKAAYNGYGLYTAAEEQGFTNKSWSNIFVILLISIFSIAVFYISINRTLGFFR